jgi:putative RecB family exonuclease
MKPLSYSQISLYLSCPLCYRLQYVDGLKRKEKHYFSFGSTLHNCVRYIFQAGLPSVSLDELLQFYGENWQSEGYRSPVEEEEYRRQGREILTRFWQSHNASFKLPLAIEQPFQIDIDGVSLRGIFDRVDQTENNELAIVDYKTNRNLFTPQEIAANLQLTLYQIAAEATWHLPVTRLTLYHLRLNIPYSCRARSAEQLREARSLVVQVAENIAAAQFPAVAGEHCPCDFAECCPRYGAQVIPGEVV